MSTKLNALGGNNLVDNFDTFRLESLYQIETINHMVDTFRRPIPINQLVVYRNKGKETYTAALSNDFLDQDIVIFRNMSAVFLEDKLFFSLNQN